MTSPSRPDPSNPLGNAPGSDASPKGLGRRHALVAVGVAAAGSGAWWSWQKERAAEAARLEIAKASHPGGDGHDEIPAALVEGDRLMPAFWLLQASKVDGSPLAMSAWKGKPLLLNFWATWCPPCLREMPLLDRFHQRWSAKGVEVLGLAVDSPGPVRAYLQKTPVAFSIGVAGANGTDISRQLGNFQGGLPFSALISADGRVLQRQVGELHEADLQRWAIAMGMAG